MAVKTLKEAAGEKERKDLLQEMEMMKLLDPHPNVVTMLGCCTEKGSSPSSSSASPSPSQSSSKVGEGVNDLSSLEYGHDPETAILR